MTVKENNSQGERARMSASESMSNKRDIGNPNIPLSEKKHFQIPELGFDESLYFKSDIKKAVSDTIRDIEEKNLGASLTVDEVLDIIEKNFGVIE